VRRHRRRCGPKALADHLTTAGQQAPHRCRSRDQAGTLGTADPHYSDGRTAEAPGARCLPNLCVGRVAALSDSAAEGGGCSRFPRLTAGPARSGVSLSMRWALWATVARRPVHTAVVAAGGFLSKTSPSERPIGGPARVSRGPCFRHGGGVQWAPPSTLATGDRRQGCDGVHHCCSSSPTGRAPCLAVLGA
jgi:hypothetical protein